MLEVKDRITFTWTNLTVEIPQTDKKRNWFGLPSNKDKKPPKQILKNGKTKSIRIEI